MRILFVNRYILMVRGGGEIRELKVAEALTEMGHEVEFFTARPLFDSPVYALEFPHKCIRAPWLHDLSNWSGNQRLLKKLKIHAILRKVDEAVFGLLAAKQLKHLALKYDYVQVFGLGQYWLTSYLLKNTGNIVLFITSGQIRPKKLTKIAGLPYSIMVGPNADKVKAQLGNSTRIFRIDEGISDHFLNAGLTPKSNNSDFVIIVTGRLVPGKNFHRAIDILATLNRLNPASNFQLRIAGDGPLKEDLLEYAAVCGQSKRINFLGHLSEDALIGQYRSADFFLCLSNYESFSMATIEAMSMGLVVIGHEVGILPQIISHGFNGFLVPQDNNEAVTNIINNLVSDQRQRNTIGKNARNTIVDQFSWKRTAERTIEIYESIGSGKA